MKTLVTICLFVVVALVGSPARAAQDWVYGEAGSKVAAKEAALETASTANLPVGVPFYVVREKFVVNYDKEGWTCNILVRYGTGVTVPVGANVYIAAKTTKAPKDPNATKAPKDPNTTKATKTPKTPKAPKGSNALKAPKAPKAMVPRTIHGVRKH